jgi:hypothetical protein
MFTLKRLWISLSCATLAAIFSTGISATINAQSPAAPKKIALVSMVGDEFTVVTQKPQTGSNIIDNYARRTIKVPGQGVNMSVLRGLDQAVGREYPDSERILLAIPHKEDGLPDNPQEREAAAYERAVSLLRPMTERQNWDQIILVTPRWLFNARMGMATKLSGIGLYVQPIESAKMQSESGQNLMNELGLTLEEETDTATRGKTARSQTYLAPYFYAVVTTLDAKTLNVIKREERYDFRKLSNPDSTAVRVTQSFEPEQLAGLIDKFIETAALRSVTDKRGSVEIGTVKDSRAAATPPAEKK